MSAQHKYPGIVIGVDASPSSTSAVEWGANESEMRNVPLKLVHAVAPIVTAAGIDSSIEELANLSRLQDDEARQIVEEAHKVAVDAISRRRAQQVTAEVLHGAIVPALVDLSKHADMIVVGRRGRGAVARALLGSVASGLAHHAHCPVAVIHDEGAHPAHPAPPARIVVGIDGSSTSELATDIAFDEASRRGAELVAVHAWTDMGPLGFPSTNWAPIEWRNIEDQEKEVLSQRLCGWRERYPDVPVRSVVVCDQPAFRLLEQARAAQLLVVGSHGRGGFPGMLLGSVSTAVVNAAQIPVIIARVPHQS